LSKVVDIVRELALPIIEGNGFELIDIEFKKEGAERYLRIFIDKPGGITIDDCELVSKTLSDKLDEADPIPDAYILEVSSPGIDRPLKTQRDFERNIGNRIEVKLYKAFLGRKVYRGVLLNFDGQVIEINDDEKGCVTFAVSDVALVRPLIEF